MQNQEIVKIIENLKGRRDYEEKKASKLGFSSLHAYIENKILKEIEAAEAETIKQFSKLASLCSKTLFPTSKNKTMSFTFVNWALRYLKLLKKKYLCQR